jgi:tRNA dimethylallyltransferase
MALYRGMDIGTAKPSAELRRRVPHHLIDVLDPWESASVAWWLERAAECCRDIEARGRRVLIVGGTPLYLKAILFGLFEGPPADVEVRRRLEREERTIGRAALHERLRWIDPKTAARLHANDVRRVIRALEVWELTGKPISDWQSQWPASGQFAPAVPDQILWLELPRDEVYARIDARVHQMFAAGLIDEVRRLRSLPQPLSKEAAQSLGYKEVAAHLDGKATLEETILLVQTRSRQFAKRQLTWFRHLSGCQPTTRELTFARWDLTMGSDREGA